jgi:hypothetical protein
MLILLNGPIREGRVDAVMVERLKWRKNGELPGRRRARRGRAWSFYRGRQSLHENFETVHDGNHGQM